jgi:hypothetical protein
VREDTRRRLDLEDAIRAVADRNQAAVARCRIVHVAHPRIGPVLAERLNIAPQRVTTPRTGEPVGGLIVSAEDGVVRGLSGFGSAC